MWDVEIVRAIQGWGDWLLGPMRLFTFMGEEQFFLVLVTFFYWTLSKPLGIDMAILLLSAGYGNNLIKGVFKRPRPFWIGATLGTYRLESFSLPSGHAQSSAAVYGSAAYALLRGLPPRGMQTISRPLRVVGGLLLILLILLIAFSRIYLGAHFPGDVLLGLLAGVVTLALYHLLKPSVLPWLKARSLAQHIGLALMMAGVMVAVIALALLVPGQDPVSYAELYAAGRTKTLHDGTNIAGAVFGLWIGVVLEQRYVRFDVRGAWWQRFLRYVGGLIGVLVLYLGLGRLFPGDPLVLGLILRFVNYALVLLWAIFAWPWLFVRLGLARRTGLTMNKPGIITKSARG